jgi:hypothetical protein
MATLPGLNPTLPAGDSPPDWIPSNTLNATRVASLTGFIVAVAVAVAPIFPITPDLPVALQVAYAAVRGAIIVASLLMATVVIAADIRARASVTCCSPNTNTANGSAAVPATQPAQGMTPLAQPLEVRVTGVPGSAFAHAAMLGAGNTIQFLVARSGNKLEWIAGDIVEVA